MRSTLEITSVFDVASSCEIDNSRKRIVFCFSLNTPPTFPTSAWGNNAIVGLAQYIVKPSSVNGTPGEQFIYLKSDKKMVKIFLKDILYIESLKDYVKVKTLGKDIISYRRISYLEEKLPEKQFLRIHRAYLIATDKIKSFNNTAIEVSNLELPIGRQYKAEVMKALGIKE